MKELLHIRDARIALLSRGVSQLGDAMTLIALSVLIARTGRPVDLTVLLVAFALPVVALASHAGRLVDSHDSRTLLTVAGSVQVVGSAGLLVSTALPWQVGCILLVQTGQAVAGPGWGALLPRIVGEERVTRAVGAQQALGSAAWLTGTALGGLGYAAVGFRGVVLADTVTFALLVVAARTVRTRRMSAGPDTHPVEGPEHAATTDLDTARPGHSTGRVESGVRHSTGRAESGWQILRQDRVSTVIVLGLVLFVVALEGGNVVESFLVIDVLGAGPAAYGMVGLTLGVGVTLGSVLCSRIAGDRRRVRVLSLAALTMGVAIGAAGLVPQVGYLFPLFFVAGVANGLLNGLGFGLVVGRAPDAGRGRVIATSMGVTRAGSVLSLLLGGVVGGAFGPRTVFVAGGVLAALVAPVLLLARDRKAPVIPAAPAPSELRV